MTTALFEDSTRDRPFQLQAGTSEESLRSRSTPAWASPLWPPGSSGGRLAELSRRNSSTASPSFGSSGGLTSSSAPSALAQEQTTRQAARKLPGFMESRSDFQSDLIIRAGSSTCNRCPLGAS